ncbi:MAG: glycoside hydrolase family 127 protein [Chloroflexota bacterium]|nr:glycoside hydrolase family 127 protein [Chloroflexota bacterium]
MHASRDLFSQRIETSSEQYAWWDAETRGNWLWGYTMMAFLSGHSEHQARVLTLLRQLQAAQDLDGYLGIYSPASRYHHGSGENGELWAQSRALLALLTAYEFTHDDTFLHSVEAAARLTMRHYSAERSYFRKPEHPLALLVGVTHGLCYVDVMEWLYSLTNDETYRDFGVWLYDDFSSLPIPFANDDLSLRSLSDPYRPMSGHAVHTAEHLRVLAWAYRVTGREDLRVALDAAQQKLSRYILPNGVLIGDESIHGLPSPDIGYEYCTITEQLFSLASLLQKFGQHADQIESLLFNAGQGARLPDGTGISYLTTDTRLDARADRPDSYSYFHGSHGRFKFSPTHEDVACCCNPNATRLLSHYVSHQWFHTTDGTGIVAVLYGACTVRTTLSDVEVEIEEVTNYPFDEMVTFMIRPQMPLRFRLLLRVPGWARSLHLTLNGGAIEAVTNEHGFVVIEREWRMDDQLEMSFDVSIDLRPYPGGEYAIFRGALQYVLPVENEFRPLKHYNHATLRDLEVRPQHLEAAYRPLILKAERPSYGCTLHRTGVAGSWDNPGLQLAIDDMTLVPMGNAVLRRAAFPLWQGDK